MSGDASDRPWGGLELVEPRVLLSATHPNPFDINLFQFAGPERHDSVSVKQTVTTANDFVALNPPIALAFVIRNNYGRIDFNGDGQAFQLFVEGDQTISAVANPQDPSVVLSVELAGVIGPIVAPASGDPAVLPATPVALDGLYTVRVSGDGLSDFSLDLFRNASLDLEVGDSGPDKILAIDDSFIALGSGRYAVVGSSDPTTFNPVIPDPVYVVSRDAGGLGGQIEVYDEDGNFQRLIHDPIFDTGRLSDVELGPTGKIFVALDVGGNGTNGGLVEFAPDGTFSRYIALPNDTAVAGLVYPAGFEVLADGTFLVPKPNSAIIQHLDVDGSLIGQRAVSARAPVDVAVNDAALIFSDTNIGNQQFVNVAPDEYGWMSFLDRNQSELFEPSSIFTGITRLGNAAVDPQEAADLILFVTNAGDKTLRKFDSGGSLLLSIPTRGLPIGLAVTSAAGIRLAGSCKNSVGADSLATDTGVAGGDFAFRVNIMPGDATGDGRITLADLSVVATNLNQAVVDGDFTGDLMVTLSDLGIVAEHFGEALPFGEPAVPVTRASISASGPTWERLKCWSGCDDGVDLIAREAVGRQNGMHFESMMVAGTAVTDITPPIPYRMCGYFEERLSTGIRDPLLVKAVVFEQSGQRAAIVFCDLSHVSLDVSTRARTGAAEQTGIPGSNIAIAATHTHTGPLYFGALRKHFHDRTVRKHGTDIYEKIDYAGELVGKLVRVIGQAVRSAAPVHLDAGFGHEEHLPFNRRFHMKDGSVQFNPGHLNPDILRPAGPIDPEVGIVALRPHGGNGSTAAIVSFALHLDTMGGTEYAADYPSVLGDQIRQTRGAEFTSLFGAGTCGDINHVDVSISARPSTHQIGARLTRSVEKGMEALAQVREGSLAVRSALANAPLQTFSDAEIVEATEAMGRVDNPETPFLERVKHYKIMSVLQRGGETIPMEVQVFRLGRDLAIVTLPGEVFVELGLAIKAASPFETTIVIELANDGPGYIPTRKAFAEGSYETVNSRVKPGGGELMVDAAIRLLTELSDD